MRTEEEIKEKCRNLLEINNEIKKSLSEELNKLSLGESFAGSVKGTILDIQAHTLGWVLDVGYMDYEKYIKEKEDELIRLLRGGLGFTK
jgi:hypothetical protein